MIEEPEPDSDFVQLPSAGWSLLTIPDEDCGFCHRPVGLFARIEGMPCCASCWVLKGRPYPRVVATPQELHERELATRERMNKRGGADRHMVRSGKS